MRAPTSTKNQWLAAVFAIALLSCGIVDLLLLQRRTGAIVRAGETSEAVVIDNQHLFFGLRWFRVLVVTYEHGDRKFVATMGDGGFGDQAVRYTGLQAGDRVTIHVDSDDPARAATKGGLSSEGRRTYLPWLLWGAALTVGQFPIRAMYRRLRGRPAAPG